MAGTEQPGGTDRDTRERELERLRSQNAYLLDEIRALHNRYELIGASAPLAKLREELRRVASTDAIVLITGESGTGKELVARALHAASRRAERDFVRLDCAALHADQLETELFGGDGAASRGALLRLAQGGTLFLDEVTALDIIMQARMLRLLQEPDTAGVRIIASTNRDLRKAVRDGSFREDLYYRLSVFPLEVPPLRARVEDIPQLVQHFVQKHALRVGRRIDVVDPDALITLSRYPWPGNVRELEGLIQRALIIDSAPVLKIPPEMLAVHAGAQRAEVAAAATGMHRTPSFSVSTLGTPIDDTENTGLHHVQREHILRVLNATHWVIEGNSGAALKLGMKPATLRHRMKKLGIARAGHAPGT
jgi:formate hydrogenlyase transcriptional activator